MSRRKAKVITLVSLLSVFGCSESPAASVDASVGTPQALRCAALESRVCPCTHGGMGTQQCVADGSSYGPCVGCPPAPIQSSPDASAADAAPGFMGAPVDASMMSADASTAPSDGSTQSSDASTVESTSDAGDSDDPAQLPVGEGVSCGVGLPTQCALGTERCCVRSLMTDTCIGSSESCECPVRGCETLEAHCDGPEDCGEGQVCCGTLSGSSYSEFRCADSCNYQGTQRIACHQDLTECPGGQVCANSQLLTNLQVCIDPASIAQ